MVQRQIIYRCNMNLIKCAFYVTMKRQKLNKLSMLYLRTREGVDGERARGSILFLEVKASGQECKGNGVVSVRWSRCVCVCVCSSRPVCLGCGPGLTFQWSSVIPHCLLGKQCAFSLTLAHSVYLFVLFFSHHSFFTVFPFFSPLLRLDIYRKVPKDLTQPTYSGALSKYTYLKLVHST